MNVIFDSVHFDADVKLKDYIERKLNKLRTYYDKIMKIEVFLKLENTGQVKDKIVELKLTVPRDTLIIKESAKTFEKAADKAVDIAKRQLKKHKELLRSY